jgi:hypothetical protein
MEMILPTTMTWKTKKKRFDLIFDSFRHLLSPSRHLTFVRLTITFIGFVCLGSAALVPKPATAFQSSSSSHAHDFVIFTTVFNDRGFALPGARTRLRRAEEKKFRWEAVSDHQGELAFRVPPGMDYEMTIEARGFKTQTRKVDTRETNRADLTFHMESQTEPPLAPHAEPSAGGKP